MSDTLQSVAMSLVKNFDQHVKDLADLVKVPSLSQEGYPPKALDESAEIVAKLFKKRGLEHVEIIKLEGVHPYIYADYLHAPGKPTVLFYAHHDVQPEGRLNVWNSLPFDVVKRDGPGGERLYGRGTADDKGGIVAMTAAVSSYLETLKKLPMNIKVIIDGEEEIGSPNFLNLLKDNRQKLKSDIAIVADASNHDTGIPSITTTLRGIIVREFELKALSKTLHSGLFGGLVPDVTMALCKMVAGLTDENGTIALKEIMDLIPPLSQKELDNYKKLAFDEKAFKKTAGMPDGLPILKYADSPYVQWWRYPVLIINGIQAAEKGKTGNILGDTAWVRLNVRVPPGMNARKVDDIIIKYFKNHTPKGMELTVGGEEPGEGWQVEPYGKDAHVFEAATKAMHLAYQTPPVHVGCGAAIPFVAPMSETLGNIPVLLVGVGDPYSNEHSENESLHLGDFQKTCLSVMYMLDEFSKVS